jgi:transposase
LWGFICKEGYGLALASNNMKSPEYIKILEHYFLPTIAEIKPDFVFMQDNCSVHKAAIVEQWFETKKVNKIDGWPSRSPDINPIENIWGEMQQMVNTFLLKHKVRNSNQLYVLCKYCFEKACENSIPNLFSSMPRRLELVLNNDGKRTKY